MDRNLLYIWLQAQELISEREGMIAENLHREYCGNSVAYAEDSFLLNSRAFTELLELLLQS
jgi:hypothetical protein